ncbi:MAG: hypothetical protein AABW52_04525 [Nanoarchaeota archaeon]
MKRLELIVNEDIFSRDGETINAWVVASYGINQRNIIDSIRYYVDGGKKVAIDSGIIHKILGKLFYLAETIDEGLGVEIRNNDGIIDPDCIKGQTLGYSQECHYNNKGELFEVLDSQGVSYRKATLESLESPDVVPLNLETAQA